jgi:Holliday junction resolvase RusA-like endonuclease
VNASFFVTGVPLPQPRPRAFAVRVGAKYTARMFDPGTTDAWKKMICVLSIPQRFPEKVSGPIEVKLHFVMPRPKYHMGKVGPKAGAPVHHCVKPDIDNLAKATLDALTESRCFWNDDAQVSRLLLDKTYGTDVGVLIQIQPIP